MTTPNITPAQKSKAFQVAVAAAIEYLSLFHPLSKECADYIKKKTTLVSLKKHELLHQSGNICPYVYFVHKGILRGYIVDNRKKITTWITSENWLVTSIRGFLLQSPTPENIEALEDCQLIAMHHTDLENAYAQFPEFNYAGRKMAEYYYAFAEDRAFICRLSRATDRYNYFMKDNSHLVNRISLNYIASYLGISIETLSRIRSRLSKKKDINPKDN